jgi:hypothetical protein
MNLLQKACQKLLMTRKGNFAMSSPLVLFIIGFFGVGVLAAIYVIVLGALYSSTTNVTAQTIINSTLLLFTNFTSQFGTIGTVAGVLLLVVLIGLVGLGGYMLYQKQRR